MEMDTTLSRREATLRATATTGLAGIALVQAIELPSLLVQGRQFAAMSLAAMVMCVGLGLTLATAPATAARKLWHAVAAVAAVVLAGWATPRLVAIPGLTDHHGHWAAMPGAATGVIAAACLALAVAAAPPTLAAARGLLTAGAVVIALAPGGAALLVALGPGLAGGETVLAAGGHIHSHGSPESAIVYEPIGGGHGGHYVYRATAVPHPTPIGLALLFAATLIFVHGAIGFLRRRSAHGETVAPTAAVLPVGIERGLA
jgi:hypothetical protein